MDKLVKRGNQLSSVMQMAIITPYADEYLMILYHGTKDVYAQGMVGPPISVDVTKGGGELGRGTRLLSLAVHPDFLP